MTHLEEFLRRKRILTKFKANCTSRKCDGIITDTIIEFPNAQAYIDKEGDDVNSIGAAFIWSKTPEGSKYWIDLSNEFHKECDSKKTLS